MNHLRNEFRTFDVGRFSCANLFDDEKEAIEANVSLLGLMGASESDHTKCFMFYRDDMLLAVGGWAEIAPGTVEVFAIPDKNVLKFPKEFHRIVRCWLRFIERLTWCERMQTASVPTSRIDHWMTALKFRCEGYAKSYTKTGEQYKLWSREKVNGIWQPN